MLGVIRGITLNSYGSSTVAILTSVLL